MGREFYVIGATARDIIIGQLADITSGRKTRDLDIAIAIPEWSVFDEIKEVLIADGFKSPGICTNVFTMTITNWI